MLKRLIPDPLIVALIGTLLLATFLPVYGQGAVAAKWVSTALIVLLFFFHGAKLSTESVVSGLRHWRLHLLILISTFVMFPLLGLGLAVAFPNLIPSPLWTGVLYLAALPSTVQSSVAFVSMARGNVSAAIASASASQVLGIFLTPVLVGVLVGAHGAAIEISGIGLILVQVLTPFIAGHLLRPWIGVWVRRHKSTISITDRGAILVAIYTAFSGAVIDGVWHRLSLPTLAILFAVCAIILACALLFTRTASRALQFSREDEIAIVFCGSKKSLVQGVPMARVLFAGPDLGLILIPLLIFHQLQLMVCAGIARRYSEGKPHV